MIQIDMDLPKLPADMVEVVIFGDGQVLQIGESWRSPADGRNHYKRTIPEKHYRATKLPEQKKRRK